MWQKRLPTLLMLLGVIVGLIRWTAAATAQELTVSRFMELPALDQQKTLQENATKMRSRSGNRLLELAVRALFIEGSKNKDGSIQPPPGRVAIQPWVRTFDNIGLGDTSIRDVQLRFIRSYFATSLQSWMNERDDAYLVAAFQYDAAYLSFLDANLLASAGDAGKLTMLSVKRSLLERAKATGDDTTFQRDWKRWSVVDHELGSYIAYVLAEPAVISLRMKRSSATPADELKNSQCLETAIRTATDELGDSALAEALRRADRGGQLDMKWAGKVITDQYDAKVRQKQAACR